MSSRALTRESGTSYLVQFFEDNEYLVVNRSRIFREGRLVTDDVANIQWGVNPKQTSEGKIIAIGDYSQMVQKLKSQKNVQDNTLNDVSENSTVAKKPRKRPAPKSSTTDKENTPAKKLKSGVSFSNYNALGRSGRTDGDFLFNHIPAWALPIRTTTQKL